MPNEELSTFVPAWRRPPDATATDVVFAGGGEMGRGCAPSTGRRRRSDRCRLAADPQDLRAHHAHLAPADVRLVGRRADQPLQRRLQVDRRRQASRGARPAGRPWSGARSGIRSGRAPQSAMRGNEGTYDEALLLIMERNGYPEETYYTFSYSPVPNDQGGTGGIICANTDDTQRIIGERQLALLRELAARDRATRAPSREACALERAARSATNRARSAVRADLPGRPDRRTALRWPAPRASSAGTPPRPSASLSTTLRVWPLAEVLRDARRAAASSTTCRAVRAAAAGAWDRAADAGGRRCRSPRRADRAGRLLVVGLNPFRLFDDELPGLPGWSPARSRPASPTRRPTRRSGGAPRRWPSSIAPRPRSSATSATSSARRSR